MAKSFPIQCLSHMKMRRAANIYMLEQNPNPNFGNNVLVACVVMCYSIDMFHVFSLGHPLTIHLLWIALTLSRRGQRL